MKLPRLSSLAALAALSTTACLVDNEHLAADAPASFEIAGDTQPLENAPPPLTEEVTAYHVSHFGAAASYSGVTGLVETARGRLTDTFHVLAEAGKPVHISTDADGIYGYAPLQPGDDGSQYWECDACRPREMKVRFVKTFIQYMIDGAIFPEQDVTSTRELRLDVPATAMGSIDYWWRHVDDQGTTHWDSRDGANYQIAIIPAGGAIVRFDERGEPAIFGRIQAGAAVRIDYAPTRLMQATRDDGTRPTCIQDVDVTVAALGTRGEFRPTLLQARDGVRGDLAAYSAANWQYCPEQVGFMPAFRIPDDATSITVSFLGQAWLGNAWGYVVDGKNGIAVALETTGGITNPGYELAVHARAAATSHVTLEVKNAVTRWGQNVYLVGASAELGAWDPAHAIKLDPTGYPAWTVSIDLPRAQSIAFKFIKKDGQGNVVWESGRDRTWIVPDAATGTFSSSWQN